MVAVIIYYLLYDCTLQFVSINIYEFYEYLGCHFWLRKASESFSPTTAAIKSIGSMAGKSM